MKCHNQAWGSRSWSQGHAAHADVPDPWHSQTRGCAWLGYALRIPAMRYPGFTGRGCLKLMLQLRPKANVVPSRLYRKPDQISPSFGLKAAFLLLPITAQSRSLTQMRTQLGVGSKADFLHCFPDNTRMISCPESLLCPHPAGKNPISKQVDAPPLLRSNHPLKADRSDKGHESKHQSPGRQLLAQ